MQNCGYEDLDLVSNWQMKLVVVKRNGTTEAAKRRFRGRGWLIDITICFGDFNLPICQDKVQSSPDPLVKSLA
jgi:hypothetical protein